MSVPNRLRRSVIGLAALALLATGAACGDGDTTSPAGSSSGGDDSAASTDFPRVVKHHKGETEIDEKPDTIVALDNSLVEAAVALDLNLVGGISAYRDLTGFPEYLGDAVADTEEVGPLESPNLEAIIGLEPDLIISASVRHDALYDELSTIADTVFVETTGPTWKDNIELLAEATGTEDKAASIIAEYEERAATVGEAINEKADNPTVSMVRFLDGPTRLYANASFSGIVFQDMGLARPEAQDVDEFAVEIGEEEIRKADADHIFVTTYSGGEESEERFLRNPLWGQLEGVKAGNVHEVADEIWMTSVSVQGAHLMMDDMAEIFDVDPFAE